MSVEKLTQYRFNKDVWSLKEENDAYILIQKNGDKFVISKKEISSTSSTKDLEKEFEELKKFFERLNKSFKFFPEIKWRLLE